MYTCTNFVEFDSPMLHVKFHDHWPLTAGEEVFLKVFTIYGRGSYLGHVSLTIFSSPEPKAQR